MKLGSKKLLWQIKRKLRSLLLIHLTERVICNFNSTVLYSKFKFKTSVKCTVVLQYTTVLVLVVLVFKFVFFRPFVSGF